MSCGLFYRLFSDTKITGAKLQKAGWIIKAALKF
jgi:hypothetical protein